MDKKNKPQYPNWFAQIAQYNFEQFLLPEAGKRNLKYLQLGVFTGDASLWLLKNILTDETSWLYDVDTWAGADNEPVQEEMDFEDVFITYLTKTKGLRRIYLRTTTLDFLIEKNAMDIDFNYDFIYVDAHHTSASALLDSELSWSLLKPGGILAIDDYEWQHPGGNPIHAPKLGIHMFLDRHMGEFDLLAMNSQVWLRKK